MNPRACATMGRPSGRGGASPRVSDLDPRARRGRDMVKKGDARASAEPASPKRLNRKLDEARGPTRSSSRQARPRAGSGGRPDDHGGRGPGRDRRGWVADPRGDREGTSGEGSRGRGRCACSDPSGSAEEAVHGRGSARARPRGGARHAGRQLLTIGSAPPNDRRRAPGPIFVTRPSVDSVHPPCRRVSDTRGGPAFCPTGGSSS